MKILAISSTAPSFTSNTTSKKIGRAAAKIIAEKRNFEINANPKGLIGCFRFILEKVKLNRKIKKLIETGKIMTGKK